MKNNSSYRQQRVASLVNEAIIEVLQRGKMLDEKLLACPLTITKITVTRDLKIANCYFLPFNTNLGIEELMTALDNSKYSIRAFVTRKINLKYSPEIRFHYDHAFKKAQDLQEMLMKLSINDNI